jgi:hypothetical protein
VLALDLDVVETVFEREMHDLGVGQCVSTAAGGTDGRGRRARQKAVVQDKLPYLG